MASRIVDVEGRSEAPASQGSPLTFAGRVDEIMAAVFELTIAASISGGAIARNENIGDALARESRALWKVKRLLTEEE